MGGQAPGRVKENFHVDFAANYGDTVEARLYERATDDLYGITKGALHLFRGEIRYWRMWDSQVRFLPHPAENTACNKTTRLIFALRLMYHIFANRKTTLTTLRQTLTRWLRWLHGFVATEPVSERSVESERRP